MSNVNHLSVIATAELETVTGGTQPNPLAPIGSAARCRYLEQEMASRQDMIVRNAVRWTLPPHQDQSRQIFSDAAILSREQLEHRRTCNE